MTEPVSPILVIAYDDMTRNTLAGSVTARGMTAVSCASFCEAENNALAGLFSGILVDLTSMIKAKGEEKLVACSLTGFYPTLRVRTMGSLLVPMIMPGGARQDATLEEFVRKSCSSFTPRRLRSSRRHDLWLPAVVRHRETVIRRVIQNISFGGAFVVDTEPELYTPGDSVVVDLPDLVDGLMMEIIHVQPWGGRKAPGFGAAFRTGDDRLEEILNNLFRTARENDRDRMVA